MTVGADFELYRTGEFRLALDEDADLPVVGDGGGDQERFYQLLAKQMYYCAKDMTHRHYHHRDSDDNLLPLTDADVSSNDENWRRETLWALARSVLEMRRRNRLPGYKHALGLLAYAEAFQSLLGQVERRVTGGFQRISSGPVYDFQHTRLSLDATIEERSFRMSTNSDLVGLGVATVLATAALWIGAVQISGSVCVNATACSSPQIPAWAGTVVRVAIGRPEWLLFALISVGGLYIEFTRRALLHLAPIGVYAQFVTEWAVAVGASISRKLRRWLPVAGDNVGNGASVVLTAIILLLMIHAAGAIFRLWPSALTIISAFRR